MNRERTLGGVRVVKDEAAAQHALIRLEPLVHVHGSVFCKELGRPPRRSIVNVNLLPAHVRLLGSLSHEATFSLFLPPGTHHFDAHGDDDESMSKEITLSGDKPDFDMGVIDLPPTIIARHIGKAAPAWTVTDARGVRKDVRLEDFKGKWVLIEFWRFS